MSLVSNKQKVILALINEFYPEYNPKIWTKDPQISDADLEELGQEVFQCGDFWFAAPVGFDKSQIVSLLENNTNVGGRLKKMALNSITKLLGTARSKALATQGEFYSGIPNANITEEMVNNETDPDKASSLLEAKNLLESIQSFKETLDNFLLVKYLDGKNRIEILDSFDDITNEYLSIENEINSLTLVDIFG